MTLKAKKRTPYLQCIRNFWGSQVQEISFRSQEYYGVKKVEEREAEYVFFSEKLREEQLRKKEKKFLKALEEGFSSRKEKNSANMYALKAGLPPKGSLQKTTESKIPFVTGLEGFFIFESSIDCDPAKVLWLYENRGQG